MRDWEVICRTGFIQVREDDSHLNLPILFLDQDYVCQPNKVLHILSKLAFTNLSTLTSTLAVDLGARCSGLVSKAPFMLDSQAMQFKS